MPQITLHGEISSFAESKWKKEKTSKNRITNSSKILFQRKRKQSSATYFLKPAIRKFPLLRERWAVAQVVQRSKFCWLDAEVLFGAAAR